jgi:hypothetical protein
MAAGQGFKTFTTGEVLTAGDVNGYLMQGVLVFASTAARDAAITSPQEGQFAYTKDTNGLWYYDGAAWVASGATGDIEGVTAGVGISGGGTSGTVTITNSMATAIDAKGDLVAGTGADTFSKLTVGANNTVLTADSAEATGLKWATASSGGLTLISTTTLSGASTSIGSIPATYVDLYVEVLAFDPATDQSSLTLKFNSHTTYNNSASSSSSSFGNSSIETLSQQDNGTSRSLIAITIPNYAGTTWKIAEIVAIGNNSVTPTNWQFDKTFGLANLTSAIDTLVFACGNGGNFSGGTVLVYGVK